MRETWAGEVVEKTHGLQGHIVTCDIVFYFLCFWHRAPAKEQSGSFKCTDEPKRQGLLLVTVCLHIDTCHCVLLSENKNVLLISTMHKEPTVSEREDRKPEIVSWKIMSEFCGLCHMVGFKHRDKACGMNIPLSGVRCCVISDSP